MATARGVAGAAGCGAAARRAGVYTVAQAIGIEPWRTSGRPQRGIAGGAAVLLLPAGAVDRPPARPGAVLQLGRAGVGTVAAAIGIEALARTRRTAAR